MKAADGEDSQGSRPGGESLTGVVLGFDEEVTGWTSDSKVKGYSRSTRHRVEEQDVIEEGSQVQLWLWKKRCWCRGKETRGGFQIPEWWMGVVVDNANRAG